MKNTTLAAIFAWTLLSITSVQAQTGNVETDNDPSTIELFLDCRRCNESFIRTEISFINYVRDKEDADVHLLITRQRTGSGGTEYTLRFIGYGNFDGTDNNLKYISAESDTDDEERNGLVKYIKMGLLPYLIDLPILKQLEIEYVEETGVQSTAKDDKWNNWVFELSGDMFFDGEESQDFIFLSGGAEARRVTPEWKLEFEYDYDYTRRSFSEKDSLGTKTTDIFITRGQNGSGRVVKSLNKHWSAGFFSEAFSSTRNNIDLSVSGSPGIEYNIFPYAQYAEREISFMYLISTGYFDYDEITIFGKTSELLVRQRLRSRMEFTQPWGEIEGRLNASAYMHDLSKNRVNFDLEFDFRIFRGLSLNLSGRYAIINDQLSIPAGEISDAEQLLDLRQQATSYSFGGSVGLEYSFGSIYNNVVNPRF